MKKISLTTIDDKRYYLSLSESRASGHWRNKPELTEKQRSAIEIQLASQYEDFKKYQEEIEKQQQMMERMMEQEFADCPDDEGGDMDFDPNE